MSATFFCSPLTCASYKGKAHDLGDRFRIVVWEHAIVLNQLG